MIYLDNAATSLIKPVGVENAVVNAMRSMASPGRGAHAPAMRAAETVFECREAAARLFKVADAENVVFTMNATHALNIAIRSVVKPGSRVLVSGFEHNSVTRPLRMLTDDITVAGSRLSTRRIRSVSLTRNSAAPTPSYVRTCQTPLAISCLSMRSRRCAAGLACR